MLPTTKQSEILKGDSYRSFTISNDLFHGVRYHASQRLCKGLGIGWGADPTHNSYCKGHYHPF